jgi:3',5'-cyclic AMP phosphodiesterase CpdA
MKIAHITDIHVTVAPRLSQLWGKRFLGTVNLYLFGRNRHFSEDAQRALVRHVMAQRPDLLICSGDVTSQATPEEFDAAYDLLAPLFSAQPTVLVPGNHDTYTVPAWKKNRIEDRFSEWTGTGDWPRIHRVTDQLTVLGVDACRAHPIASSGIVSEEQLGRIGEALVAEAKAERRVIVVQHYPLRDRRGEPYGPKDHSLLNARALEAVYAPFEDQIVGVLHGHQHHGFQTLMPTEGDGIPIFNSGSSGYAHLPAKRRTAHYNTYDLVDEGLQVSRYSFDGDGFRPEEGGAYATGR